MATHVSVCIEMQEYASIIKVIPNDPDLPSSYIEFLKCRIEEDDKAIADGFIIKEVNIDYKTFAKYCESRLGKPTFVLLMEHAVDKAFNRTRLYA